MEIWQKSHWREVKGGQGGGKGLSKKKKPFPKAYLQLLRFPAEGKKVEKNSALGGIKNGVIGKEEENTIWKEFDARN